MKSRWSKYLLGSVFFAVAVLCQAKESVVIFNPVQWDGKTSDSELFNDIVSAELSCQENIKLVDREQLNKILEEKALKPNGMLGTDDVCNIGTLLGADSFVSGSVRSRNNKLMIFIKTISVKSSVVKMKYISVPENIESAAKQSVQLIAELLQNQKSQEKSVPVEEKLMKPDKKRPVIAVFLPELHIANQPVIDPAAENELTKYFISQKFNVKQIPQRLAVGSKGVMNKIIGERTTVLKAVSDAGADYLVFGEAISESSGSFGNWRTCRARVELKIISAEDGTIIFADSIYAGAADTAEIIAGKKAIQKAAAKLAPKAAEALLK